MLPGALLGRARGFGVRPIDRDSHSRWQAAASLVGWLLLFGIGAAMVSGLLQTLSLTVTNPVPVDSHDIGIIGNVPVDFADRLSVFTTAATNLTIAIMLVGAAVTTRFEAPGRLRKWIAAVIGCFAVIVIASDAVMAVEVMVTHGPLFLVGVDATTRATAVVGLLAPAAVAVAAGALPWLSPDRAHPESS